jgi:hypothetical protein
VTKEVKKNNTTRTATGDSEEIDWLQFFSDDSVTEDPSAGSATAGGASGSASSVSSSSGTEAVPPAKLDDEVKEKLAKLDTDYSKVQWGVVYSLSEEFPGCVVSVAPFEFGKRHKLVVAITNLYESELTVSASVEAKAADDSILGKSYIFAHHLGSTNTMIETIDCGDAQLPDGRIRWTDLRIRTEDKKYYTPWESDWEMSGNPEDRNVQGKVTMYEANGGQIGTGGLYGLLLDEQGYILADGCDFVDEEKIKDGKASAEINFYGDEEVLKKTKDMALFSNPIHF